MTFQFMASSFLALICYFDHLCKSEVLSDGHRPGRWRFLSHLGCLGVIRSVNSFIISGLTQRVAGLSISRSGHTKHFSLETQAHFLCYIMKKF